MVRKIGGLLEAFKFSIYVTLPIGVIYVISNPAHLRRMLDSTQYVVYPPEGPRPPVGTLEEVRAHMRRTKEEKRMEEEEYSKAQKEFKRPPTTPIWAKLVGLAPFDGGNNSKSG